MLVVKCVFNSVKLVKISILTYVTRSKTNEKNFSKGELFSIACNEVKKIEEQEGKYFEYR